MGWLSRRGDSRRAGRAGGSARTPPGEPRTGSPRASPSGSARRRSAGTTALHRIREDRKSTRLNSSHVKISYAVFCLKKKKKKKKTLYFKKKKIKKQKTKKNTRIN